jgi:hypothetical protein
MEEIMAKKTLNENPLENVSLQPWDELTMPFDTSEVMIRILMRSKDRQRGRVVPYIEGNGIRNRLDQIAGRDQWSAEYEAIIAGTPTVLCRLTILGITKQNMGTGDDFKAACTDSLKRAAMEHGIGRYLAYCPEIWVDLNEHGFLPDKRRARALVLHMLGHAKAEIERALEEDERVEQEVKYLLYQFRAGAGQQRGGEDSKTSSRQTKLALAS